MTGKFTVVFLTPLVDFFTENITIKMTDKIPIVVSDFFFARIGIKFKRRNKVQQIITIFFDK